VYLEQTLTMESINKEKIDNKEVDEFILKED
jgi:hypothetical protein